jgi:hypothetical protein
MYDIYLLIIIVSYSLYIVFFSVSLQEKLGEGIVEPRSLEDEGIFVGKKPVVPTNLVHRAEKRILQECATDKKVIIKQKIFYLQKNFS